MPWKFPIPFIWIPFHSEPKGMSVDVGMLGLGLGLECYSDQGQGNWLRKAAHREKNCIFACAIQDRHQRRSVRTAPVVRTQATTLPRFKTPTDRTAGQRHAPLHTPTG